MTALAPALLGFVTGLSLIVAIGSQNVFVLRQGVRREHAVAVVLACALSDMVLIAAGTAGLGALVSAHPGVVTAARWGGAAFLLVYAALAAHRALRPAGQGLETVEAPCSGSGLLAVLGTTLALTWLNPHVYLDTVLLLGSLAANQGDQRWVFAAGAIAGSAVWFTALGLGARALGRVLSTPRAWRILDSLVAVTMVLVAATLVIGA